MIVLLLKRCNQLQSLLNSLLYHSRETLEVFLKTYQKENILSNSWKSIDRLETHIYGNTEQQQLLRRFCEYFCSLHITMQPVKYFSASLTFLLLLLDTFRRIHLTQHRAQRQSIPDILRRLCLSTLLSRSISSMSLLI